MLSIGRMFLLALLCGIIYLMMPSLGKKYHGPQWQQDASWMMDEYAVNYGKAHDMDLVRLGDFTEKRDALLFGIWLRAYSNTTLEEGKQQMTALVQDFLQALKHDPRAVRKLHGSRMASSDPFYPPNIESKIIGVKIAYWNKEVMRPLPPYLAEMDFYDDTFYYYQADPKTQALVLVFKESYEEALSHTAQAPSERRETGAV